MSLKEHIADKKGSTKYSPLIVHSHSHLVCPELVAIDELVTKNKMESICQSTWRAVDNSNKHCRMTFWANKNTASHGQKSNRWVTSECLKEEAILPLIQFNFSQRKNLASTSVHHTDESIQLYQLIHTAVPLSVMITHCCIDSWNINRKD